MAKKIMLVEDDSNLREIYGARLLAEGYEIVSAQDGEEALALAVKEKPDLVISDVMMPKISGFDMLDILRSTPETKNTKVMMMTALSQVEDKARADKLGADKYLVKSQVTLEDVARASRELLGDKPANDPQPADKPSHEKTADKPVASESDLPAPSDDGPSTSDDSDDQNAQSDDQTSKEVDQLNSAQATAVAGTGALPVVNPDDSQTSSTNDDSSDEKTDEESAEAENNDNKDVENLTDEPSSESPDKQQADADQPDPHDLSAVAKELENAGNQATETATTASETAEQTSVETLPVSDSDSSTEATSTDQPTVEADQAKPASDPSLENLPGLNLGGQDEAVNEQPLNPESESKINVDGLDDALNSIKKDQQQAPTPASSQDKPAESNIEVNIASNLAASDSLDQAESVKTERQEVNQQINDVIDKDITNPEVQAPLIDPNVKAEPAYPVEPQIDLATNDATDTSTSVGSTTTDLQPGIDTNQQSTTITKNNNPTPSEAPSLHNSGHEPISSSNTRSPKLGTTAERKKIEPLTSSNKSNADNLNKMYEQELANEVTESTPTDTSYIETPIAKKSADHTSNKQADDFAKSTNLATKNQSQDQDVRSDVDQANQPPAGPAQPDKYTLPDPDAPKPANPEDSDPNNIAI